MATPTSQPPHIRLAICGAGVGGLILAVILSRSPHISVDLYEAASELKEIGAGIGMWPRTWKIAKKLGLAEELEKKAIVPAEGIPKVAFQFRRGDLPQGHTFQTLVTPGLISFHRPDFQSVLLDALARNDPRGERCRTFTGKKLVSYVDSQQHSYQGGDIELRFADGTTARCDFLVGADGVKSNVRATLCRHQAEELRARQAHASSPSEQAALAQEAAHIADCGEAVWSGTFAYRTTIKAEELQRRWRGHRVLDTPHVYLGKNSQMTVYPMARGTLVNFAAFRARYERENTRLDAGTPMVSSVSKEEFREDFGDWEEEAKVLIDCLDTTSRWAVHTVKPLKSFISSAGNVVLLGDAAHAMMPFQGSGAGQAIEDAYILGTLLTHPHAFSPSSPSSQSSSSLQRIAKVYDAVRRPMAQHVASVSRDAGMLYTLNYPGLTFDSPSSHSTPTSNGVNGVNGVNGGGGGAEEEERLQEVYARIRMNWEWAWDTSAEGDLERAVGLFESGVEV
ncbi:FAD/NAD(P)-binding domain-containing protein [Irpex lacteus]|nr:FAD/NAD(P)-binding domain-containing protein [Irpex lacteus]